MMRKRILATITAAAMFCSVLLPAAGTKAEAADTWEGRTFYVSSIHGSDRNDGRSEATPFYSLQKINDLTLQPGDRILLESGSVFTDGYLHLRGQSGSAEAPIVIDQYGGGAKPIIDTNGQGVWYQNYGNQLDNQAHVHQGYVSSSILLYDTEYIEINNLEIVNKAPAIETAYNAASVMDRTGVAGVAQNKGALEHIYLNGLYIHDVIGNVYNKHMDNGGIYFTVAYPTDLIVENGVPVVDAETGLEKTESGLGIPKYDDLRIENCTVENVNRWGIAVGYTAFWKHFLQGGTGYIIPDEDAERWCSTNVLVRNNFVKDAGGDAITFMYCHRPVAEYNVADGCAKQINTTDYVNLRADATSYPTTNNGTIPNSRGGRVAAGIWPWACKDALFQYNECYDMQCADRGNDDAQAWDADSGDGTIYQYNYSHNNGGGCVMFCLNQSYRNTFRYNISQGDLKGMMDITNNRDAHVYNNVFIIPEGQPFIRMANRQGQGNMLVENNIIYYEGASPRAEMWQKNAAKQHYSNNLYYNYTGAPAEDTAAVVIAKDAAQIFQAVGTAPTTANSVAARHDDPNVRSPFDGYKLAANSPAIGKGKVVVDQNNRREEEACTKDFFGNDITAVTTFDIGAHQYQPGQGEGAPAAPQKVETKEVSETSATISWAEVLDPMVGIAGYRVMDGTKVLVDAGKQTSAELTGLKAGTEYTVSVVAYDVKGVASAEQTFTFKTAGTEIIPDTTGKGNLEAKLAEIKASYKAADYTAESWNRLQKVIQEAEAVLNNSKSTKAAVDIAMLKLGAAVKGLQKAQSGSLSLDRTSATIYTKGKKTVTLKATGVSGSVTWNSSNTKVAVVKDGKVTAKKAGKTVITASAGSYKATCTITVKKPTLKISGKKSVTIKKGKKSKIKVKAVPTGKITYKSSNKKVASVTAKGVIKGVKAGSCKITVTCNGVKKTVKVKVK